MYSRNRSPCFVTLLPVFKWGETSMKETHKCSGEMKETHKCSGKYTHIVRTTKSAQQADNKKTNELSE